MPSAAYACKTVGCVNEAKPTGARWCTVCGVPTTLASVTQSVGSNQFPLPNVAKLPAALRGWVTGPAWSSAIQVAGRSVAILLGLSLLLVGIGTGASPEFREVVTGAGGFIRLTLAVTTFGMKGGFTVDSGELGAHLSIGAPLLGLHLVALLLLARSSHQLLRASAPKSLQSISVDSAKIGLVFAGLLGFLALISGGTLFEAPAAVKWSMSAIRVAWWALWLGTTAALVGSILGMGLGRAGTLLRPLSPHWRSWIRAAKGSLIALAIGLSLALIVGLSSVGYLCVRDACDDGSSVGSSVFLVLMLLPVLMCYVFGVSIGGMLQAGVSQIGGSSNLGLLPLSGLSSPAYLLLLIPVLAFFLGAIWTVSRELGDPEPQPGTWVRMGAASTLGVAVLLLLSKAKISGNPGNLAELPFLYGLPSSLEASVGLRGLDTLGLAFAWSAAATYAVERWFSPIITQHGGRIARLRIRGFSVLPARAGSQPQGNTPHTPSSPPPSTQRPAGTTESVAGAEPWFQPKQVAPLPPPTTDGSGWVPWDEEP